jgi:hypothetical protein
MKNGALRTSIGLPPLPKITNNPTIRKATTIMMITNMMNVEKQFIILTTKQNRIQNQRTKITTYKSQ